MNFFLLRCFFGVVSSVLPQLRADCNKWGLEAPLEAKKYLKRKKFRQKLRESLKYSNLYSGWFRCLEVGTTACQTWGLLISLECSCNWLPLFEKNKAEKRPLGNFSSFSFKVFGHGPTILTFLTLQISNIPCNELFRKKP